MAGRKRKSIVEESMVGIFWLVGPDRLIFDVTRISEAQLYAHALTHPRGHLAHWTALQQSGMVLPEIEYEEYPRGRVVFYHTENKFRLFADPCILARPAIVRRILSTMHLPRKKTEVLGDAHYRCAKCLEGKAPDD